MVISMTRCASGTINYGGIFLTPILLFTAIAIALCVTRSINPGSSIQVLLATQELSVALLVSYCNLKTSNGQSKISAATNNRVLMHSPLNNFTFRV